LSRTKEIVSALHDVLQNVGADGRVRRSAADRLRKAIRAQNDQSGSSAQDLVASLPPYETLPGDARAALVAAVLEDDSWSMRLRRAVPRQVLTRAVRTLGRSVPDGLPRLRRGVEQTEFLFLYWQARLAHMLYRRTLLLLGWNSSHPPLAALLSIVGLDARVIASSYLRQLPQPAETAGYWHDAKRHTTVGVVVGIDFIVNDEGVWFVESNLNVGLMEERSRLYTIDPFVTNLIQFARQRGYTSLIFLACNDVPVDDIMAERIKRAAEDAGLRATVLEDRYAPQRRLSQTFLVPPIDERTLVVRSKMFHISLDAIFHHKTLSFAALEAYQRAFPDRDVRLPPTSLEEISRTLRMDGPFPNLVCKFPERDQGQGVLFMKVPSLARAQAILDDAVEMNRHSVANIWTKLRYRFKLEDQTSVFQPYIPSSLGENRSLSIVRAQVFASPVGIQFLSAHRVVSNLPTPESLEEGLVHDPRPYIVNYSLDSRHAPMAPEDESRVEKAALSVVRGLCWAVESRYQTGPLGQSATPSIEQPALAKEADGARFGTRQAG
jgi:hypothetical protein